MQQDQSFDAASEMPGQARAVGCTTTRRGYAAVALAIMAVVSVNIATLMHDVVAPTGLPAWKPIVWEISSGVVFIACAGLPLAALRRAMPGAHRWWHTLGVHVAASLLFSMLHVAGMIGLRKLVYATLGQHYMFTLSVTELVYEYRKDALAYCLVTAIFWVVQRLSEHPGEAPAATVPPAPEVLEIRDGARHINAYPDDILYARAGGNYVEIALSNGQRPLMRTTLAALEARLAAHGFVRTHRSWMVNLRHVRESAPTGSGDFVVQLSDGTAAPVSRRYSEAVGKIRGVRSGG